MGIKATMRVGDYTAKAYGDGDLLIERDDANPDVILDRHQALALAHFIIAALRVEEQQQPEAKEP